MGSFKIFKTISLCFKSFFYARIKTYRAIDVNSLFGYMGGYVGVLLRYSVLQVPDLLLEAIETVRRFYTVGIKRQKF